MKLPVDVAPFVLKAFPNPVNPDGVVVDAEKPLKPAKLFAVVALELLNPLNKFVVVTGVADPNELKVPNPVPADVTAGVPNEEPNVGAVLVMNDVPKPVETEVADGVPKVVPKPTVVVVVGVPNVVPNPVVAVDTGVPNVVPKPVKVEGVVVVTVGVPPKEKPVPNPAEKRYNEVSF